MLYTPISTNNAPGAVGPYSQAVKANGFLYISGQLPIVPAAGTMPEGDFGAQAKQSMLNIGAILEEAGLSFANVIKTTIYLTDMSRFGEVNQSYGTFFDDAFPARACVEVNVLPKGALVEIEAVAVL